MNRAINRQLSLWSVAALLCAAALPIHADVYVSRAANGDYIRLFDEACPVASGWLKLRRAEWFYQGKLYKACWTAVQNVVVIHDEQGAVSPIPLGTFQKEIGT